MSFCKCIKFISSDEYDYICECGHDIHDHVHEVVGGCESAVDWIVIDVIMWC